MEDGRRAMTDNLDQPEEQHPPAADWVVVDDEPTDEGESVAAPDARERPLDARRVRQLSAERRGAYRARSYCLIGMVLCAAAAVQLIVMTVRNLGAAGWSLRPLGYLCGVAAAVMAATFLVRRYARLTQELRAPVLPEPQTPPDLSTLSDGSQLWKNLDEMQRGT